MYNQCCIYTEEKLSALRRAICDGDMISSYRLNHTLGVEKECAFLASIFGLSENDSLRLRAAALLHDVTKEKPPSEQLALCEKYAIAYPCNAENFPKIFHGWTAAALARDIFPEYCDEQICRAIHVHTTGQADMSLFESLLFLADYIEPGRKFDDCVTLRSFFREEVKKIQSSDPSRSEKLLKLLESTLIRAFDYTISCLISEDAEIFPATVEARNSLVRDRNAAEHKK